MCTLPVYALNLTFLNFQQLLKHILGVFSCLGGGGGEYFTLGVLFFVFTPLSFEKQ